MKRVIALLVAAFVAVSVWLFVLVPSAHPRHADAIVVLAGDRHRLEEGVRLLHEHVAPVLVISRDPDPWARADALCAHGSVCFHAHPYSTRGEAETVARLVRAKGWHTLVVVTSRYHITRARMLFTRCLHTSLAFVAARTTTLDYIRYVPWEWVKLAYQFTIHRAC
jgi:uncharacterized SAM-binding protein YcdF (DUF218 family)